MPLNKLLQLLSEYIILITIHNQYFSYGYIFIKEIKLIIDL